MNLRLELLYLIITVPCGLLMILFDRYPARNDSGAHWLRALQVASGVFLPIRNPSGGDRYGAIQTNGSFVSFNNTAVNSPFLYYPTIVSQFFMRHQTEHTQYVAASITTLLCCSICIAVAIHFAREFSELLAAVAFLPTVFLSLIFPTADAVTNSFSLLFIALVIRYATTAERNVRTSLIVLSALCIGLGQIKSTCLVLMLLIIPATLVRRRRNERFTAECWIPLAFGLLSETSWLWCIRGILPWTLSYQQYEQGRELLVQHPFEFLKGCFLTLIQPLDITKDQYNVQRNIQWYTGTENTMLPMPVMGLFFVGGMILLLISMHRIHSAEWSENSAHIAVAEVSMGIVVVLFYIATCAAMALIMDYSPSQLGEAYDGMQSRYFVPVAPLLLIMVVLPSGSVSLARSVTLRRFAIGCIGLGYLGVVASHMFAFSVH